MTELEEKLLKQLEIQQEVFIQELRQTSKFYIANMNEAKRVIEIQKKELEELKKLSPTLSINIETKQFQLLQEKLEELRKLDNTQISSLKERLREISEDFPMRLLSLEATLMDFTKRLEKLEEQLKYI